MWECEWKFNLSSSLKVHQLLPHGQDHLNQPFILCHLFLSISLNLSSSTILVEIFPKALKRATISFRDNLRSFFTVGRPASTGLSNSPENRILRAVPNPVTLNNFLVFKNMFFSKFLPVVSPRACTCHTQRSQWPEWCFWNAHGILFLVSRSIKIRPIENNYFYWSLKITSACMPPVNMEVSSKWSGKVWIKLISSFTAMTVSLSSERRPVKYDCRVKYGAALARALSSSK